MFIIPIKEQRERVVVFYWCTLITVKKQIWFYSGDIAAAVGLRNTSTGETLCDEKTSDYFRINGYVTSANLFYI